MTRFSPDTRDATRTLAFLTLVLAVAVTGTALVLETVFDTPVCDLCLYQRLPWYAILGFSALAARRQTTPDSRVRLLIASAAVSAAGALLAFYHVGVEAGWWAGDALCAAASLPPIDSLEALTRALEDPARRTVRCDDTQFLIPGLPVTLAWVNAATSLMTALVLAVTLARISRRAGQSPR